MLNGACRTMTSDNDNAEEKMKTRADKSIFRTVLKFLALSVLAVFFHGCPAGTGNEIEFRLASKSPKVGFIEMADPFRPGTIYVDTTPYLTGFEIMDVETVRKANNTSIQVIFMPEASEKVKELYEMNTERMIAVFVNREFTIASEVSSEYSEGLMVISSQLPSGRMLEIARSMGHT